MTCAEYRKALMDVARGSENFAARLHARECPACAAVFWNQQALSAGLSAVGRAEDREPSAELQRLLLAECKPRVFAWRAVAVALAAAAILVTVVVIARRPADRVVRTAHTAEPKAAESPLVGDSPNAVGEPVRPVKVRRHFKASKRSRARESDDLFEPVPYQNPLSSTEHVELVRVNMSVSGLASIGLPIEGADPNLRLEADLLLGENGLARAWRPVIYKSKGERR
jgi:hypothetical protein